MTGKHALSSDGELKAGAMDTEPEPLKITLTPPPAPKQGPHQPSPSKSPRAPLVVPSWRVPLLVLLSVGVAVFLVVTAVDMVFAPSQETTPTATADGSPAVPEKLPCPAPVSSWMPDSGREATLIASYTTEKHVITLCRDTAGLPYYNGHTRGAAPSRDTLISLPAEKTATGYIARNMSYVYEISGSQLIVTRNGLGILQESLTRVDH